MFRSPEGFGRASFDVYLVFDLHPINCPADSGGLKAFRAFFIGHNPGDDFSKITFIGVPRILFETCDVLKVSRNRSASS